MTASSHRGGRHSRALLALPLFAIVLLIWCDARIASPAEAKLIRATVVFRVPPYGPFTRVSEEDEVTEPLHKLSGEETLMAVRVGKKLRELYVRAAKVIPPRYDDDALDLVSTDTVRATQAAQALGIGLFDRGGDNTFFELPPSRHYQGIQAAIFEPCRDQDEDAATESVNKDQSSFWSEFQRFLHVRSYPRFSSSIPPSWVFESAYETLRTSVTPYRDDALLNRARILGTAALNAHKAKPSRMAQEIFFDHFATEVEPSSASLRIFVVDDNNVMQDLLGASLFTHEAASVSFPLPRVLSFELHDESEIDPDSSMRFIRILQDFSPVTCSAGGEFYCNIESFLAHPGRIRRTNDGWRDRCHLPSLLQTLSPTSSAIHVDSIDGAQSSSKPEQVSPTLDASIESSGSSINDEASAVTKPTCSPSGEDSTEEEFIHGFLWGLALAATVYACRCSPRKHHAPMDYHDDGHPADASTTFSQTDYGDIEHRHRLSMDDEVEMSPMRNPVDPSALGVEKMSAQTLPRPIAHIPRPKPNASSGVGTSNSPLLSSMKNTED